MLSQGTQRIRPGDTQAKPRMADSQERRHDLYAIVGGGEFFFFKVVKGAQFDREFIS